MKRYYTYTTIYRETYSENNYLRYFEFNAGITYYFKKHINQMRGLLYEFKW